MIFLFMDLIYKHFHLYPFKKYLLINFNNFINKGNVHLLKIYFSRYQAWYNIKNYIFNLFVAAI